MTGPIGQLRCAVDELSDAIPQLVDALGQRADLLVELPDPVQELGGTGTQSIRVVDERLGLRDDLIRTGGKLAQSGTEFLELRGKLGDHLVHTTRHLTGTVGHLLGGVQQGHAVLRGGERLHAVAGARLEAFQRGGLGTRREALSEQFTGGGVVHGALEGLGHTRGDLPGSALRLLIA